MKIKSNPSRCHVVFYNYTILDQTDIIMYYVFWEFNKLQVASTDVSFAKHTSSQAASACIIWHTDGCLFNTSMGRNSTLHPMSEFGGGGLNLIVCQLVDWIFCNTHAILTKVSEYWSNIDIYFLVVLARTIKIRCELYLKVVRFVLIIQMNLLLEERQRVADEEMCNVLCQQFVNACNRAVHRAWKYSWQTACFNDSHTRVNRTRASKANRTHYKQRCSLQRGRSIFWQEDKEHTASSRCQCVLLYLHLGAVCWYLRLWSAQCHCICHHSRRGSCQLNHTVIYWSGICCFSAAAEIETTPCVWKSHQKHTRTCSTSKTSAWPTDFILVWQ